MHSLSCELFDAIVSQNCRDAISIATADPICLFNHITVTHVGRSSSIMFKTHYTQYRSSKIVIQFIYTCDYNTGRYQVPERNL